MNWDEGYQGFISKRSLCVDQRSSLKINAALMKTNRDSFSGCIFFCLYMVQIYLLSVRLIPVFILKQRTLASTLWPPDVIHFYYNLCLQKWSILPCLWEMDSNVIFYLHVSMKSCCHHCVVSNLNTYSVQTENMAIVKYWKLAPKLWSDCYWIFLWSRAKPSVN